MAVVNSRKFWEGINKDAVLFDNAGDVALSYRGQHLVPSSERREEIRAAFGGHGVRGKDFQQRNLRHMMRRATGEAISVPDLLERP